MTSTFPECDSVFPERDGVFPGFGRPVDVDVDVLVATCERPEGLTATLAGLAAQTVRGFRVVIADQSRDPAVDALPVRAMMRVLRHRGSVVEVHRGRARRGVAEQRQFLLDTARARQVLFLDDDVLLEPSVLARLVTALTTLGCGFVGAAVTRLSHVHDVHPDELASFEVWDGPVVPERIRKHDPAWERWRLHNAANIIQLAATVTLPPAGWLAYKIAWVGGCVLFDRARLCAAGGFSFWRSLPPDSRGEDVVAQLRVMESYGGAGILPSGAFHLELPTAVQDCGVDAYARIIEEAEAEAEARDGAKGLRAGS